MEAMSADRDLLYALQTIWGFEQFRDHQQAIVEAVLADRDVLAVLPTGGGKSLTFQLPALLSRGTTLVVTPLVALMENQVRGLRDQHIAAASLHSEQPAAERRSVLEGIDEGRWSLLYLAPETLLTPSVWARLMRIPISRIVLDEAHCLASWGSSFRPAYHRLGAARRALGHPPLCAFTATATPQVLEALVRLLGLIRPRRLVVHPYRPNLNLQVHWTWTARQRRMQIAAFLEQHRADAGLVYLRTRHGTEQLATALGAVGWKTAFYHAGVRGEERRRLERDWLSGKLPFLICTNAFGMGIDHPHVRWVLHANLPSTLEEYMQEIGRAGRDGQAATALLLASEPTGLLDSSDRQLQVHLRREREARQQKACEVLKRLPATGIFKPDEALSLALLHEQGRLIWETPFEYRRTGGQEVVLKTPDYSMSGYVWTRRCRWQFLLAAFGLPESNPCGHCDRCCNRHAV